MLEIHVRLHGLFRERLPLEAKGRTTLMLPEGATIGELLQKLDIERHYQLALNEEIEVNLEKELQNGDKIEIFRPSAGGRNI